MDTPHTRETVKFNGLSGYYGSLPSGYGGFNYTLVNYLNASYWENVQTNWCDTGYQNVISGPGEAYIPGTGLFESANLKETFSLIGMVAASAWETNQPVTFNTYVYSRGNLKLKASDTVYFSQTAQTVDFATLGGKGDFRNISAVTVFVGAGSYGNTCTYGRYSYTTGYQFAFDNLKVRWSGSIPRGDTGKLFTKGLHVNGSHEAAHVAAHLIEGNDHRGGADVIHPGLPDHHPAAGYHSQLLSLPDHDPGGLTSLFHSPTIEHFGT